MHTYKIQLVQKLKPYDNRCRRDFAAWPIQHLSEEYPYASEKISLQPEKCTVWCNIHAHGIMGPYFLGNAKENHITVN